MSSITTCSIKILNRSYQLKCPVQEELALRQAAQLLEERMRRNQQRFPALDDHKLLLLAALDVCHETVTKSRDGQLQRQDQEAFIQGLEQRLEQMMLRSEKKERIRKEEEVL